LVFSTLELHRLLHDPRPRRMNNYPNSKDTRSNILKRKRQKLWYKYEIKHSIHLGFLKVSYQLSVSFRYNSYIIYRPFARGFRWNIALSDDISPRAKIKITTSGNISSNTPPAGSINYKYDGDPDLRAWRSEKYTSFPP
jgi:hypothetical protein